MGAPGIEAMGVLRIGDMGDLGGHRHWGHEDPDIANMGTWTQGVLRIGDIENPRHWGHGGPGGTQALRTWGPRCCRCGDLDTGGHEGPENWGHGDLGAPDIGDTGTWTQGTWGT